MKRIIFLILIVISSGCSQITVEDDFNSFVSSIIKEQQVLADKMSSLQTTNITDFKQYSQEKILPLAKEFLDNISKIQPQTKEISSIHEKYVEATRLNYEVQMAIGDLADQNLNPTQKEELVAKAEQGQKLVVEWQDSMDDYALQYNIKLPNVNIEVDNRGIFIK